MRAHPSRAVLQRHLVWLLWLALLLPVAQVAATWHTLSHAGVDKGDAQDKPAHHQTQCELCLTAAAVTGNAPPDERPPLPHPAVRHAAPQAASSGVWFAPPTRAYRSRAPPFVPH